MIDMSKSIDLGTEKVPLNQLLDRSTIEQLLDQLKKEKNDEHDRLIGEFFNHCLKKCKEGKLKFMLVVAVLLPYFISDSDCYQSPVSYLRNQITYVRLPPEFLHKLKFPSTHENLWGYKFPYYKFPDSNYKFS